MAPMTRRSSFAFGRRLKMRKQRFPRPDRWVDRVDGSYRKLDSSIVDRYIAPLTRRSSFGFGRRLKMRKQRFPRPDRRMCSIQAEGLGGSLAYAARLGLILVNVLGRSSTLFGREGSTLAIGTELNAKINEEMKKLNAYVALADSLKKILNQGLIQGDAKMKVIKVLVCFTAHINQQYQRVFSFSTTLLESLMS
ncbi:hypothetical protein Y032_0060g3158 [Ancylostoma ceylanicum]|uniref:Uncharacterized protein n=1 Tax=Ancylostoma ceylanicum TaxID=53326 RepID=A0A016U4H2_9BILA|nr:hypothetical protein Y032_0060g3158 [Ancylostoma ceylanicum]